MRVAGIRSIQRPQDFTRVKPQPKARHFEAIATHFHQWKVGGRWPLGRAAATCFCIDDFETGEENQSFCCQIHTVSI